MHSSCLESVVERSALTARCSGEDGQENGRYLNPSSITEYVALPASTRDAMRMPCALRRVSPSRIASLLPRVADVRTGDLALARVESIGKNTRIELTTGRHSNLHEGDLLAVVFGNRYATNQFEGYAKTNGEICDLLSMGGLCGLVASKHDSMPEPTKLRLLGMLGDESGRALGLREWALPPHAGVPAKPHVTVVCGTTMDSGKTHTVMSVLLGLTRAKRAAASVKLTGTACGRDTWKMHDAGARPALDFVDGGYASTYQCGLAELIALYDLLLGHAAVRAEHVVLEIADGLLQQETSALLNHPRFRAGIDTWLLAAADPVAAAGGVALLKAIGIRPIAVSGLLTRSSLAIREAEAATGIQCITAEQLQQGQLNPMLRTREGTECRSMEVAVA